MAQLDQLLSLLDCSTPEAWSAVLISIARDCGFSHILFGIVPNKTTPFHRAFLKSNYPASWRNTYDEQQLHTVDPTVSHCLSSVLPIAWNSSTFTGPRQHEFYEEACSYGLRSGISYPIHGTSGEFGVMSFITADSQHLANTSDLNAMAKLSLIRDYATASSMKFLDSSNPAPCADYPGHYADNRSNDGRTINSIALNGSACNLSTCIKLTPRELECIKWIMCGKSSWEIAKILYCAEGTINFHVANLMKKFKVNTRQQAVVKAIKEGIIEPA